MQKPRKNFVITDLDDTIWDWLKMWHSSFAPFFKRIAKEHDIDEEELANDFKRLHQKYNTTESSFIVDELSSLSRDQKKTLFKESENQKSIIHEYNSNKKSKLEIYDGVLETLQKLKLSGCKIVGFTESKAFFTKYRIKHLELDGLFDCIYAPVDFNLPDSVNRFYDESFWEPRYTEFRYLPKATKKPSSEILDIIIKDFKAQKKETIYIGDKLDRDIYMANLSSVTSVYAKYGDKITANEYELLRKVTHWPDEDVAREKKIKADHSGGPKVDYTLRKSYSELLEMFEFFEFSKPPDKSDKIAGVVEIWKKIIDVQQHFNDIALRIKNLALTAFTFIIAGVGYCFKEDLLFTVGDCGIRGEIMIAALGIILMSAFFYIDRFWYHKLLIGSVKQGTRLEKKWGSIIPEIKLTQSIGEASPHPLIPFTKWKIHSNNKFIIFYGFLISVLILVIFLSLPLLDTSVNTDPPSGHSDSPKRISVFKERDDLTILKFFS